MNITASAILSFFRPVDGSKPSLIESALWAYFNAEFPDAQGDLFSYIENAQCSCKAKLIRLLNLNPDKAKICIDIIYNDSGKIKPTFVISQDVAVDNTELVSVAGTVLVIPADIDSYRNCVMKLHSERKVYQGIFIKDLSDKRWQLFFY